MRDTPANLELVEQMINSLDKSKAEVLIDVNIYEVSRNNLLQIGNQFSKHRLNDERRGAYSRAQPARWLWPGKSCAGGNSSGGGGCR